MTQGPSLVLTPAASPRPQQTSTSAALATSDEPPSTTDPTITTTTASTGMDLESDPAVALGSDVHIDTVASDSESGEESSEESPVTSPGQATSTAPATDAGPSAKPLASTMSRSKQAVPIPTSSADDTQMPDVAGAAAAHQVSTSSGPLRKARVNASLGSQRTGKVNRKRDAQSNVLGGHRTGHGGKSSTRAGDDLMWGFEDNAGSRGGARNLDEDVVAPYLRFGDPFLEQFEAEEVDGTSLSTPATRLKHPGAQSKTLIEPSSHEPNTPRASPAMNA